jgi:DNA-binding GntR family transcriptional regulator
MQLNTRREPGYMLRVFAEHERLVDAVEARDETAAIDALHVHLHTSEYVAAADTYTV